MATLQRRQALLALPAWLLAARVGGAKAHGSRLGDIVIDHPYATPTPAGAADGALYFRRLKNSGRVADRLIGAHCERAAAVRIERGTLEGGVLRLQTLDAIELPPGAELSLRHDGDLRLTLVGLKAPLKEGERFAVRLSFERAGEKEVTAWVQRPR